MGRWTCRAALCRPFAPRTWLSRDPFREWFTARNLSLALKMRRFFRPAVRMSSIGVLPRCEFSSILVIRRGGSSVGRALRSQCRGRGFDSLPLHWHNPTMLMHRWVFLCAPAGDPEGPEENDRPRGKADPIGGSPRMSPPLPVTEQSRGSRRQRGWSGASAQEAITAKMLPPVLGWNPVPVWPSGGLGRGGSPANPGWANRVVARQRRLARRMPDSIPPDCI